MKPAGASATDKDGNTREYASAGRYTTFDGKNIRDDVAYRNKLRGLRGLADSFLGGDETVQSGKIAAPFEICRQANQQAHVDRGAGSRPASP